jgi:hypothetical protein
VHIQSSLFKEEPKPSDVVYTPEYVAADIVEWLMPGGVCLDPCKGDGAFYNFLPDGRLWCELELGKNFFDFKDAVDWVIGNPPYSIFEEFLVHSFEISPDVCFLVPTNKIFQRKKIMEIINEFGGIKGMRVYGSGLTIGFPFGFSVGAFHFQKHFRGGANIVLAPTLNQSLVRTQTARRIA